MRNHTIHPQLEQVFSAPYLSQLQKVTFQKGNYICTQGQDITELTYILSGRVKIVRSLSNGKEHILEMPQQPQLLGDVELMTNQLAGSSVIALEEVQTVQLPLNNKEALLKDPIFLYHIGRNLAMALHRQGITAPTNASYFVKERLATHILNIEEQDIFQLSPSILSSSFGTSYRHVQRVIKQFIDQGIIEKKALKPIAFYREIAWKPWLSSIKKTLF